MELKKLQTKRIQTAYRHSGTAGKPKLLLVHGNVSSSVFYIPLMKRLGNLFECVAPDLRCFGDSEAAEVDATRGMRDFSDDLDALVEELQWDKFSILGWSMGGCAAMQYAIDHSEKLERIILQAPGSPFGFGGTYDEDGKMLEPPGLASGGGCANAQLVESIKKGERELAEKTLDGVYVAPPYKIEPELKEMFIDSILSTKIGEGMYPGDKEPADCWPYFKAGKRGVCNTMAPNYCNLSPITEIPNKPPILWIRGSEDVMVSDQSIADIAWLGKSGFIMGYPGEDVCKPQPMVSQTRYVMDQYRKNGGEYQEVVIRGGHGCMLDNQEEFARHLIDFMIQK